MTLPVACTLSPEAVAARKAGLLPALAREAEARQEMPDGLRLRFNANHLQRIVAVVDAERQCCRFLRFEVTVEPDFGAVWLALSGPAGTKEFLAALIDS